MTWTEELIIEGVQRLANELGRTPTKDDMIECNYLPTNYRLSKLFKQTGDLLLLAGLTPHRLIKTDAELIQDLKDFYTKYNRSPRAEDMKLPLQSYNNYILRFGSWDKALKLAGLTKCGKLYKNIGEKSRSNFKTDEDLLSELRRFYEENNRTPNNHDTNSTEYMSAKNTYIQRFKTWNNALELAGLTVNLMTKTDDELIQDLIKFSEENGRSPTAIETTSIDWMATYSTYRLRVGTWNKALLAAGLDVNDGMYGKYVEYEGYRFDSIFEFTCYKILRKYYEKIDIQVNKRYPNNKYINDFYISDCKLWIEVTSFSSTFKHYYEYVKRIREKKYLIDSIHENFLFIQKDTKILEGLLEAAFNN